MHYIGIHEYLNAFNIGTNIGTNIKVNTKVNLLTSILMLTIRVIKW